MKSLKTILKTLIFKESAEETDLFLYTAEGDSGLFSAHFSVNMDIHRSVQLKNSLLAGIGADSAAVDVLAKERGKKDPDETQFGNA